MDTVGSRVRRRKRAWRSWLWNVALAVGMLVLVLISLIGLTDPVERSHLDAFGWVLYPLLTVLGLAAAVVALRMGLVATSEGIVCRLFPISMRIRWAQVEPVSCEETGGWLFFPLYAPVINYRRPTKDGAAERIASMQVQAGSLARRGMFKRQSVAFRAATGLAEELARYRAER
ncbi:MAG TPA: hypothetical protein VF486_13420 [Actinomycetes bacterium]